MIHLTVHGVPAPQGSMVRTRYGVRPDNPKTKPWRNAVAAEAASTGGDLLTGPVELNVRFYFPRPKGHYGTGKNADVLKKGAPAFHTSKPDIDKLVRAIGDALTGIVLRDDSQIVSVHAIKMYGQPRAEITIDDAKAVMLGRAA